MNKLWCDGKTEEEILLVDPHSAVLNLLEDIQCLKEGIDKTDMDAYLDEDISESLCKAMQKGSKLIEKAENRAEVVPGRQEGEKAIEKLTHLKSLYVELTNSQQYAEGGEIKGHYCSNDLLHKFDAIFDS